MTTPLERLKSWNAGIAERDPEVLAELAGIEFKEAAGPHAEFQQESIILRRYRPVLPIRSDQVAYEFHDREDSQLWKPLLQAAEDHIHRAAMAVGRIEITQTDQWFGTGWLVGPTTLVTNRHVAQEFGYRASDGSWTFSLGTPRADFLQELDSTDQRRFDILQLLYLSPAPGPDIALFEIAPSNPAGTLAEPVPLIDTPTPGRVAVLGYPAFDSRIPDFDLMTRIYQGVYNKKRLAPGEITEIEDTVLLHNATTLGGNSGSVVMSLDTGEAVGLHYSGSFLRTNRAVRADQILEAMNRPRTPRRPIQVPEPSAPTPVAATGTTTAPTAVRAADGSVSVVIPLTVTVALGTPQVPSHSPAAPPDTEEARPEDYLDRDGYQPSFLGVDVPLPVVEDRDDVVQFEFAGNPTESVLRYTHFSVEMSAVRRMCIYSAVNIDGLRSVTGTGRPSWRFDPRIPREQQIRYECYGNPPKFSRGHMTRREDPAWGTTRAHGEIGARDSMHVTNATPQMQAFNSPIWLSLEDYALDNAREADQRISVFTGPYFDFDNKPDPEMYGVRIPRAFWKVIAFIHDETGELCATGYQMSQDKQLPKSGDEEFVFGQHKVQNMATQVPIAEIEQRSGLDFGPLRQADPLNGTESASRGPLLDPAQIQYR